MWRDRVGGANRSTLAPHDDLAAAYTGLLVVAPSPLRRGLSLCRVSEPDADALVVQALLLVRDVAPHLLVSLGQLADASRPDACVGRRRRRVKTRVEAPGKRTGRPPRPQPLPC